MKPIKLTAIILAVALTVLATALVISLISYSSSQKSQQKLSAPAAVNTTSSKPIQPVITPKLVTVRKTTDTNVIQAKNTVKPVITAQAAGRRQKAFPWSNLVQLPTVGNRETASMTENENSLQSPIKRPYMHPRKYKPMLEDRQLPVMTHEQQRHIERYKVLENTQRVQISKEQQEQMKNELFLRIPERYRQLFKNIDQMKKEQLEKSKQAPPQAVSPDNLDKQVVQEPNQGIIPEPPSSE